MTNSLHAPEDTAVPRTLGELADTGVLQAKLDVMATPGTGVAVLFFHAGATHSANAPAATGFSADTPVQAGCVMKSFTATIVASAVEEGQLRLEDSVGELLDPLVPSDMQERHLDGLRIHHLLTHTHGFDDTIVEKLPRSPDGFIDSRHLLKQLACYPRIAEPGALFNYSNIGAWLAAAILEHRYRDLFSTLLARRVLAPLEITGYVPANVAEICPAIGGELRMSARELLAFALAHCRADKVTRTVLPGVARLRDQHAVALPDWPPVGRSAYPGWIDFGESFGHLGLGADSAALLRFFPRLQSAIVITATHLSLARTALLALFGNALGDVAPLRPPRQLSLTERASVDLDPYVGTYANSKLSLQFDVASDRSLRVRVFRHGEDAAAGTEPYIKRHLRPAVNHIFLPTQPEPLVLPSLQFTHPAPGGRYRYVRTGSHVFARDDAASPSTR